METERVKVLAKSVDYGIHRVATEHTKLLAQSTAYGSLDWLKCTTNPNSKECVVRMPKHSVETLCRKKTALTLEELMHYENDPWWKCVRQTFMISFWLALVAFFTSACIIAFLEDKQHCAINPTKSTAKVISDGVLHISNLSSVPTLLIESTTKKFFTKLSIEY